MQLLLAFVLCAAVIGSATSSPGVSVPILSHLSDADALVLRPSGQLFRLPLRQPLNFGQPQGQQKQKQEAQPNLYYGVPPPPEVTDSAEELTTTTEMPTTTAATLDQFEEQKLDADAAKFDEEGVYYIYHPDGLLQRVAYGTKVEDMGYTARLTYKDVEPIKDPIYTYDPQTLRFTKVAF